MVDPNLNALFCSSRGGDLAPGRGRGGGDRAAGAGTSRRALDLGRVAVSNAIWEKPGPFGLTDWERVQLHPYFTERSFAHASALASIGELAGSHHERLDGGGYHRKTPAPALGRAARILAAADSYQAMLERRPHRPALDAAGAEAELLASARDGRLCPEAVSPRRDCVDPIRLCRPVKSLGAGGWSHARRQAPRGLRTGEPFEFERFRHRFEPVFF